MVHSQFFSTFKMYMLHLQQPLMPQTLHTKLHPFIARPKASPRLVVTMCSTSTSEPVTVPQAFFQCRTYAFAVRHIYKIRICILLRGYGRCCRKYEGCTTSFRDADRAINCRCLHGGPPYNQARSSFSQTEVLRPELLRPGFECVIGVLFTTWVQLRQDKNLSAVSIESTSCIIVHNSMKERIKNELKDGQTLTYWLLD